MHNVSIAIILSTVIEQYSTAKPYMVFTVTWFCHRSFGCFRCLLFVCPNDSSAS